MRIALFSAYFPPHIGGVEKYTLNMANQLEAMGHDVTIITSASKSERVSQTTTFPVIEIPSISIMDDRFPIIKLGKSFRTIVSPLKSNQFDGYIINTRYYPICFLGCHLAKINRKPLVLIDHSSGYLSSEKSLAGATIRFYEKCATRNVLRYQPHAYSVSEQGRKWIEKLGFSSMGTIPNSIDLDKYLQSSSFRNWPQIDNQCTGTKIGYIGRLVKEKGVETVIDAVKRLRDCGKDVDLIIAGNGPLAERIAGAEDSFIHYVGPLTASDACSLMDNIDIFCYPSIYPEGLPTVLLEAAAHKLPIVASNCAGAIDVIPTPQHGAIVNNPSPESIAKALCYYIDNPGAAKDAGRKTFQHVKNNISWEASAKKLIEALLEAGVSPLS